MMTGAWNGRCVVFGGRSDRDAPSDYAQLREALRRRGIEPEEAADAYGVMADLVEHERRAAAGSATDLLVLLLVEPRKHEPARRLAAAASAYTPHVVLWSFDARENPRLSAYDRPDEVEPEAAVVEPGGATPGHQLRLTGVEDPFAGTSPVVGASENPPGDGGLAPLTEDELDMLLADEGDP
jgi:hypothetical protein